MSSFCKIMFWFALDVRYMMIDLNAPAFHQSYFIFDMEISRKEKGCRV